MSRSAPMILMCAPDFFGIEYEINPWMHRAQGTNRQRAMEQWQGLVAILQSLQVKIERLEPRPGLPDLVFTANAGVVYQKKFVPSRFHHVERQRETPVFEAWFREHGYEICPLPGSASFEGAGDALYCGQTLFAGYRHRSEIRSHVELANLLGCEVLSLELVDPRYYHLDTCFCPLAAGIALYYPPAFDDYALRVLRENIPTLIEVADKEAERFGCNAVAVGQQVVHNSECPNLAQQLANHGFTSQATPLDEFLKSGGSAKCLTLRLDGEEAAPW